MKNRDEIMLQRLDQRIATDIPNYERKVKEDSKLMRVLAKLFKPINSKFLHEYVTTFYPKVFFPKTYKMFPGATWKSLAHEWVHLHNAKKETRILHWFMYLIPQNLAIFALLSLVAIWASNFWLLNLLWLLCLAPLPAPFRAEEEFEGYTMSMAVEYWRYGSIPPKLVLEFSEAFTGSGYYYMQPSKAEALARLNQESAKIELGEYDNVRPYSDVKQLIEETWSQENV